MVVVSLTANERHLYLPTYPRYLRTHVMYACTHHPLTHPRRFLDVGDRIQCEISIRGERLAQAYGNSKTIARRMAATEAMQALMKWPA